MRPRAWLLAVAGGCFAAGIAVGLALPVVAEALAPVGPASPEDEFVERLRVRYDLRPDQVRLLRMVHEEARRERLAILDRVGRLPQNIQDEIKDAQRRLQRRLEGVLDADQLARYRADLNRTGDAGAPGGDDPTKPAQAGDRDR